jgi:hypothetical protein
MRPAFDRLMPLRLGRPRATLGPHSRGLRDMDVSGHPWPQPQKSPPRREPGGPGGRAVDAKG